jgi:glycosidase
VNRATVCLLAGILGLIWLAPKLLAAPPATSSSANFRDRLPEDEIVYFLLPDRFDNADPSNDRGGLAGGRLQTGFDPTDKAFYHGGDLRGVLRRLDYIQALGATAIWVAPIFKNKPVQGTPGHESAAYHGYWITDFTRGDPHFGTNDDFAALVKAAHARGMKVYMDIVANHTADVIRYRECSLCPYRSRADYPYTRHGGAGGERINEGFLGDDAEHQTAANFAHLTRPDYAYTPYLPAGEEHVKVPDWLNDPIYYHNRGASTFSGESSTMGDFVGLDDVMTENPRVVQGFIDIYGAWIDNFGVDGFRIDTAKHVNPEFWQAFVPAMLARARAKGILNFHIFGEVYSSNTDVGVLAEHTRVDKLPAVLDFALKKTLVDTVAGDAGTDEFARLFAQDALYEGADGAARHLPTFVSNHDQGRFGYFVRKGRPGIGDEETLQRVALAYAMLFTLRGVPVIYYGDEQGFAGTGEDMDSREDMFASQVAQFNAESLIGSHASTASANFNPQHPLFGLIHDLAQLRSSQAALRRGRQVVRIYNDKPGLLAVSRLDPQTGRELLIAFNTSTAPLVAQVEINAESTAFDSLHGSCVSTPSAPASYPVTVPPLGFIVCAARAPH